MPAFCAMFAPATTPCCPVRGCRSGSARAQVGWVKPDLAAKLRAFPEISAGPDGVTLTDAAALPAIARQLSDAGCYRWRREAFDIRAEPDGPVLARLDRGALPSFGVLAVGVHVNGLVRRADGLHVWVARRAANKLLDPVQARPHRGRRSARRPHAGRDAGEGGRRGGRDPRLTGSPGGAGRDHHLRDGAAGGTAPRPAALLRPGPAGGISAAARPMARWRRSNSGRSNAWCRPYATRTSSSSTSIWC